MFSEYPQDFEMDVDASYPEPLAPENDDANQNMSELDLGLDLDVEVHAEVDVEEDEESDDELDVDSDGSLKFPCAVAGVHNEDLNGISGSEEDDYEMSLPESVQSLREELLGGYKCPLTCPDTDPIHQILTPVQRLSLKHYVAWKKSNGTVQAFKWHADVLKEASGLEILSIYSCRQLAAKLTELEPEKVDICPKSCIAYTGQFKDMTSCPYKRPGEGVCGIPRYHTKRTATSKSKPQAQMLYLPVMATIKAMFANAETALLMRHRDRCLQEALRVTAEAARTFSDFGNSKVHMHHFKNLNLFQEPRDIAFAISSDGAQLTMKKKSDTWLLLLLLLNLPPDIRYKTGGVIINFATPGPNPPGNMESFVYTLFQSMAKASEGIWMWDAVESSYFVNKAHICLVLGDMLGSAKLNGMAGHAAIYGDRFSMVKAARSSTGRGAKALYYPIKPPCNAEYNPDRPEAYDLDNLPIRKEEDYWNIIVEINGASSEAAHTAITKKTGVSRLPLCAASFAYTHPTFFPMDSFHLLFENNAAFMWDLITGQGSKNETFYVPETLAIKFGQKVTDAMKTLPSSFCGRIRDPHQKRQSQYKIYEWMGLVFWYMVPLGIELGFDPAFLKTYSYFVEAVEFVMTVKERSEEEIKELHKIVKKFLEGFEKLFIHNDPTKISRFRLCVFQLIHLPLHVQWYGSVKVGSQATCERMLGEMSHKIHSKKAPFANLANIIYETELVKLLLLYYPSLNFSNDKPSRKTQFIQKMPVLKSERRFPVVYRHLEAICCWLNIDFNSDLEVQRYGKYCLPGGNVLRSRLSENSGRSPERSACYFEAVKNGVEIFGEALAFFSITDHNQDVLVYKPLVNVKKVLCSLQGNWQDSVSVLPVSSICHLVGIITFATKIYILRKHAGLDLLSEGEQGHLDGDNEIVEEL
jgi:hypothetical protein